jgi:hypothetical protein
MGEVTFVTGDRDGTLIFGKGIVCLPTLSTEV